MAQVPPKGKLFRWRLEAQHHKDGTVTFDLIGSWELIRVSGDYATWEVIVPYNWFMVDVHEE